MADLRLAPIVLLVGACAAACGSTGTGPAPLAPAETGATAVVVAPSSP
jgi:shikimate kinase